MKTLHVWLAIWLVWFFEAPFYRDTAEFSADGGKTWAAVPGPYELSNAAGRRIYRLNIDGRSGHLFRVRREFGMPWL